MNDVYMLAAKALAIAGALFGTTGALMLVTLLLKEWRESKKLREGRQ